MKVRQKPQRGDTCPHLSTSDVRSAVRLLRSHCMIRVNEDALRQEDDCPISVVAPMETEVDHGYIGGGLRDKNLMCVGCNLLGKLGQLDFHEHFLNESHHLCVRIEEPYELFCNHCGDFQYSEYFDTLLCRKRILSSSSDAEAISSSSASSTAIAFAAPVRGLCNMGSTCFMNSVLQLLLHNEFVKQMCYSVSSVCGAAQQHTHNTSNSSDSINNSNSSATTTTVASIGGAQQPEPISNGCIACEILNLLLEFKRTDLANQPIAPSNVLYSLWCHADYLAGYDQQDAHEFLIALLDGFDSHLKKFHSNREQESESIAEAKSPSADAVAISTGSQPSSSSSSGSSSGSSTSAGVSVSANSSSKGSGSGYNSDDEQTKHIDSIIEAFIEEFGTDENDIIAMQKLSKLIDQAADHQSTPAVAVDTNVALANSDLMNVDEIANTVLLESNSTTATSTVAQCISIHDLFAGKMNSSLMCLQCHKVNSRDELFLDICLSVTSLSASDFYTGDSMSSSGYINHNSNSNSSSSSFSSGGGDGQGSSAAIPANLTTTDISDTMDDVAEDAASTPKTVEEDAEAEGEEDDDDEDEDSNRTNTTNNTESTSATKAQLVHQKSNITVSTTAIGNNNNANLSAKISRINRKYTSVLLTDCLREYSAKEFLTGFVKCESCDAYTPCCKQLRISIPPKILVIQLKRFDYMKQEKISTKVVFPIRALDICAFLVAGASDASSDIPVLYDLQGLICHSGSLHQGHYISYVAIPSDYPQSEGVESTPLSDSPRSKKLRRQTLLGQCQRVGSNHYLTSHASTTWIRCDDEVVTEVSEDVVREAEGYLFVYVARDV